MDESNVTEPDRVLKKIEDLATTRFLPIIGPRKGKYLVSVIRTCQVKKVLEVGTLIGYSAILIAKNLPPEGRVTTIEIHPAEVTTARENIKEAGLEDKIEVIPGNALEVIPKLKDLYDLVFLDAAKEEYLAYLKLAEGKLKTGGIVFADNVKIFAEAMADYLDYVGNSGRYRSEYIDAGPDAVEISIKLF